MSDETGKSVIRRLHSPGFVGRYFVGDGIDIGAGSDSLLKYNYAFPQMVSCRSWDVHDGDAQYMHGVSDESFDFVTSSHCLEHMHDAYEALKNWWRILRPCGYLVVMVPEWHLYEHKQWPSQNNTDHKHAFTIIMSGLEPGCVIPVTELIATLTPSPIVQKIELLDQTYDYNASHTIDQTRGIAEAAIEFILRKP